MVFRKLHPRLNVKPHTNHSSASARAKHVGKIAKKFAKGTLIAAALTATRLTQSEAEPQTRLFNPATVDRLNEPLSRHHE